MKNDLLNIRNLSIVGDICFFEGPLMSLFFDKKTDDFYIFDWVDVNENYNKWLVYQTNLPLLMDFFERKLTHRYILENAPNSVYYIVEVDNNLRFFPREIVDFEAFPSFYLPTEESFFSINDCPDYDKIQNFVSSLQSIAA